MSGFRAIQQVEALSSRVAVTASADMVVVTAEQDYAEIAGWDTGAMQKPTLR